MKKLTHTDEKGKARMVDVGNKPDQVRRAVATGYIRLKPSTVKLIKRNELKKGDVLTVAQLAGIQAAKRTPELIPLCHNIFLSSVSVEARLIDTGVEVTSVTSSTGKTGVEMEALTSVNVALLTVYDMCKAVDNEMIIENVKLIEKTKNDITG
ncbi:MAG: cyclic pyranopterin monophosphate synthase MoaC [Bacteroidia bacterium]|nr:MAG: cyclic pyranopterin monophosphate synthase MoaC [Bacteroidia bacterium]